MISRCACSRALPFGPTPARASCTPRPPRAPGLVCECFDIWTANARDLAARGITTAIPYTVDGDGFFTDQAPGFKGKRVITHKGDKGDANEAVIKALAGAGMLIGRGRR